MTTIPTTKVTQDSNDRAQMREAARLLGNLLREERRAADLSLAREFAASEAEFERWFNSVNDRESDE